MALTQKCITDSMWKVMLILSNYCQQFFNTLFTTIFRNITSSKKDEDVSNPEFFNNNSSRHSKTMSRSKKVKMNGIETKSFKKIPGPLSLPFVGTMLTTPFHDNLMKSNEYLVNKFGSLVKMEFYFNYPVVNIYDANDIEVVTKLGCYYRPPAHLVAMHRTQHRDRYTALGVAHANGEEWARLRSLLEPQLQNTMYNRSLTTACMDVAEDFVQLFSNDSEKIHDNFEELVFRLNFECACLLILGKRMNFLDAKCANQLNIFIESCPAYFRLLAASFTGFPLYAFFADRVRTEFYETEKTLYDTWADVVEELRDRGELGGIQKCIFDANSNVSYQDRRTLGMDLILGALEPVHNTVIFIIYLIATHEHVATRVFEELVEVMPTKDCIVDETSLDKMNYLKACIQESYRLMPTAPRLARLVETDVILQGYHIPANTLYLCQHWYASVQESNFYRAKDFLPERWLVMERDGKRSMPYSPHTPKLVLNFGFGKRECPGRKFFQVQSAVVLAKVFRNYKVEFLGTLKTKFEFLLAPAEPIPVRLIPRPE